MDPDKGQAVAMTDAEVSEAREGRTPPDRPQVVKPVKCPNCWSTSVRCNGTHDGVRHYVCQRCCDTDGYRWRFKVSVAR